MIGSLVLKLRQKYKHGLSTAYFRDVVRLRILDTQPITQSTDRTCEIHVLTCATDWLNLLWALKSFYYYSQRHYVLCIHDDGSLTSEHQAILKHHFPNARLINHSEANEYVLDRLKDYPRCQEFRRTNKLSLKVFDFAAYLESDRMLLLDSDILFFAQPTELLRRIEDPKYQLNTVNGDVASAYTIDPQVVQEKLGFDVIDRFNSGLGLIHKSSMRFDWIEEFLALPDIIGHFWRIEQTLYALFSSRFGTELLPSAYDVHLEGGIESSPSRHYVGKIRHLMYKEGIQQLVKQEFLHALSSP
jgi:alpha-N-acetylglucosamine transferase